MKEKVFPFIMSLTRQCPASPFDLSARPLSWFLLQGERRM